MGYEALAGRTAAYIIGYLYQHRYHHPAKAQDYYRRCLVFSETIQLTSGYYVFANAALGTLAAQQRDVAAAWRYYAVGWTRPAGTSPSTRELALTYAAIPPVVALYNVLLFSCLMHVRFRYFWPLGAWLALSGQAQPSLPPGYIIEGQYPRLAGRHVYLLAAERPSPTRGPRWIRRRPMPRGASRCTAGYPPRMCIGCASTSSTCCRPSR